MDLIERIAKVIALGARAAEIRREDGIGRIGPIPFCMYYVRVGDMDVVEVAGIAGTKLNGEAFFDCQMTTLLTRRPVE